MKLVVWIKYTMWWQALQLIHFKKKQKKKQQNAPYNVLSFLMDLFHGYLSISDFFFKDKMFPSKNSKQMWISDFQIWECSDQELLF